MQNTARAKAILMADFQSLLSSPLHDTCEDCSIIEGSNYNGIKSNKIKKYQSCSNSGLAIKKHLSSNEQTSHECSVIDQQALKDTVSPIWAMNQMTDKIYIDVSDIHLSDDMTNLISTTPILFFRNTYFTLFYYFLQPCGKSHFLEHFDLSLELVRQLF